MKLTVTPLDDLVSIEYTDDDSFLYRKEMVPHHVASAYIAAFKGEVVFHKQPPLTLVTWNMPVLIGHRAHPVEQQLGWGCRVIFMVAQRTDPHKRCRRFIPARSAIFSGVAQLESSLSSSCRFISLQQHSLLSR